MNLPTSTCPREIGFAINPVIAARQVPPLRLVATAEGIESESQLESVRELGCDHAQGFLFARPVPAEQVSALLVQFLRDYGTS